MQKRYVFVIMVMVIVCVLVWRLSSSYAIFNQGYTGNNIVSGNKWGINIVEINDVNTYNKAIITKDISTISTTLNFDVALFSPGDKVSFDVVVSNTSQLNAELYATTLSGLSSLDSEVISYEIIPLDYINIHSDVVSGSIIKSKETQTFRINVTYDDNVSSNNNKEYNLSLGASIIYQQK